MRDFWEHFDARNNNQSYNKWDHFDVETTIQNVVKLSVESNYCANFRYVAGARTIRTSQFTAFNDGFLGFHGRWQSVSATGAFLQIVTTGGAVTDLTVAFNAGKMVIKTGPSQTIIATGDMTFLQDTWYHIEFHLVIHDSAGLITSRVNGLDDISVSSIDTAVAGPAVTSLQFSNQGSGTQWYLDNVMINNTDNSDGLNNTSWIGPREMFVQFPIGDGTTSVDNEWLLSSGSTRFGQIDEPNVDADTTYIYTQTDLTRQRNTFPNVGLEPIFHVFAVGFEHVARGISGLESVKLGMKDGTVSTLTAAQSLVVNYKTKVVRFQDRPSGGGNWTVSTALGADSLIESAF